MNPLVLAGPAVEPVPLAGMKSYLRVDGTDEDDLVAALIMAGRLAVERATRLSLIDQTWRWRRPGWPPDRTLVLPFGPVRSIAAVRVGTGGGATATLPPDRYRLEEASDRTRLVVERDAPDPAGAGSAIEIEAVCGFGASPASVPEPLVLAVRRLAAFWFEHRGDEVSRGSPALPPDVQALIAPFTRPRLA